jgi:hypothetical protein
MKKILFFSLICVFSFCSCIGPRVRGNGTIKTETRETPVFESITCDGAYDVHIVCRGQQSVLIQSDENILPYVRTEVDGTTLRIRTKGHCSPTHGIQVVVSVPKLSGFKIDGSADGDIQSISSDSFSFISNGSSHINLSGSAEKIKIHIAGSAKINADSLLAGDANVRIEGSGDIRCHATKSLDGRIDGAGSIKYLGDPETVDQTINGSGSITKE